MTAQSNPVGFFALNTSRTIGSVGPSAMTCILHVLGLYAATGHHHLTEAPSGVLLVEAKGTPDGASNPTEGVNRSGFVGGLRLLSERSSGEGACSWSLLFIRMVALSGARASPISPSGFPEPPLTNHR